jgi:hypothetical protein
MIFVTTYNYNQNISSFTSGAYGTNFYHSCTINYLKNHLNLLINN